MITLPGIVYLAVNNVNDKLYVGKTGRELPIRIREHMYDARNKYKTPFSKAIRKYGIEYFTFTVLETCDLEESDTCERFWISVYDCRKPNGYNLTEGGDGALGIKRPDISLINSRKLGPLNPSYGKTYTPEERVKFGSPGESNPRFGVKLTEEFKAENSKRIKAAMHRPEVWARFIATRGNISDETRLKMSISAKAREAKKRQEKKLA